MHRIWDLFRDPSSASPGADEIEDDWLIVSDGNFHCTDTSSSALRVDESPSEEDEGRVRQAVPGSARAALPAGEVIPVTRASLRTREVSHGPSEVVDNHKVSISGKHILDWVKQFRLNCVSRPTRSLATELEVPQRQHIPCVRVPRLRKSRLCKSAGRGGCRKQKPNRQKSNWRVRSCAREGKRRSNQRLHKKFRKKR